MVWGAFCSSGKLRLAFVSSRMNCQDYINVIEAHLLPFLRGPRRRMFAYQQEFMLATNQKHGLNPKISNSMIILLAALT